MPMSALSYLTHGLLAWHPLSMRRNWPGLAIAVLIALAATFLSTAYGGPQLLYALFFGLALHWLWEDPTCRPGIQFCSQTLLRSGIAMLGARVTWDQVATLGPRPLLMVVCAVAATIGFGCAVARLLGRPRCQGVLSGGAVGICGAAAAMAISAVLPQTKENEQFTLLTVVGVTTLSTIAMVAYPLLVHVFGLSDTAAGVFIGATIHDVAQAVGAGYMVSGHAGDTALLVKLTRVACLVPVILAVAALYRRQGGAQDGPPLVPLFLVGFVCLMLANSAHLIAPTLAQAINGASRACLVLSIAALGMKTSFQALASLGWQPVLMLVSETLWLALTVLAALRWAV